MISRHKNLGNRVKGFHLFHIPGGGPGYAVDASLCGLCLLTNEPVIHRLNITAYIQAKELSIISHSGPQIAYNYL